jgi:peptide chain release factor subunit 1
MVARFSQMKSMPDNGVIVFCGEVITRGDRTDFEYHNIVPPIPVKSFAYRCSSQFETADAENLLERGDLYGLIVLDLHESCWGTLEGSDVRVLGTFDSLVPNKHSQGGQSAQRFERLRGIAINGYFTKLGERVNTSFLPLVEETIGILIGGCGMTKDEFARGNFLHHELRKKIVGTFDTSYTNEFGLPELVCAAKDKLSDIESARKKELFDEFLKELAKDTGKAVYGIDNVVKSVKNGRAAKVFISSERNDLYILVSKCTPTKPDIEILSSGSDSGSILDTAFGGMVSIARYSDER